MAGSRFAYVRSYEALDAVLPNTFMLVRLDGKGFHRFSDTYAFAKPNDARALELMNHAAAYVVESFRPEIVLAFGESDEYSFLLRKLCKLYNRRQSKILTHITSSFTAAYVSGWSRYFPDKPLTTLPSFDGRLVVYPGEQEVRDYFSWRAADTHINNLYNTTFWALVHSGKSEREAHERLKGTVSSDKHELLHSEHGINYDRLPALFRRGSTLVWAPRSEPATERIEDAGEAKQEGELRQAKRKVKDELRIVHADIISPLFWKKAEDVVPLPAREEQDAMLDAEEWMDVTRTQNWHGLGARALGI